MIEGQVARPCLRSVTGIALGPELPAVEITLTVAIGAFLGKRLLAENPMVARGAGKRFMSAHQGKISFATVVEDAAGPPPRRVAILAFPSKAPIVIILGGMTRRA